MSYSPSFTRTYPNGWKDRPDTSTPAYASTFEKYENTFEAIEDFLDGSEAVKPVNKTSAMTQDVGFDPSTGKLYTKPGSGGGGGTASSVAYDNTESQLESTNVQDAIDEVNNKISTSGGGSAENVTFDPEQTTPYMQATNVQDAIVEVFEKIDGVDANDIPYDDTTTGLHAYDVQSAIEALSAGGSGTNYVNKSGDTMSGALTIYAPLTVSNNRADTENVGQYSVAEGYYPTASGNYSHAEGDNSKALGTASHAEGRNTQASNTYSHAEGDSTKALGYISHAEGINSITGDENTAGYGTYAHAEGNATQAKGQAAHSEGRNSLASGYQSHAEGYGTIASGASSHAEGFTTTASGDSSHSSGSNTTAGYSAQFVCGKYNDNKSTNLFEIGNGSSGNNSNAFEVDSNGNVTASGTITDGNGNTIPSPVAKTSGMTQPVGIDGEGKLFTTPGGGGGGGTASDTSYDNTQSGLTADDVQSAIDELASDFQDGCDTIVQAVTAKGQTPASNSPEDIATAIGNISGGGIQLMLKSVWDALTTAQKRTYGLLAIQDANSGFDRGELVYGADYVPSVLSLYTYTVDYNHTYNLEAGTYLIMYAISYQSTVSITLPQDATILSTVDEDINGGRRVLAYVIELDHSDVVSASVVIGGSWTGRVSAIIKLDNLASIQNEDFESTVDGTTTYTLPNNSDTYLVYGLAISRTQNTSRDDTTNTSGEEEIITGDWGAQSVSRVAICQGNNSPNYSFYGYDGGFSAVISWKITTA